METHRKNTTGKKRIGLGCGCLLLPLLAWGWGEGHDTIGRAVATRLPAPWAEQLHDAALTRFCKDNHYPDDRTAFAANNRVTPAEVAYLAQHKMKDSGAFHSDEGRAVAFCLMVHALRENRPESVLLWLASLAHSTADMAACNHDPIVHLATYAWSDPAWNLEWAKGVSAGLPLDLAWVERSADTKAVWDTRLARIRGGDSGKNAADAVLDVMLDGMRGVEICAPHGVAILRNAAAWTAAKKKSDAEALAADFSELGAWAVEKTLCDFRTAERLARQGDLPDVTDPVRERYTAAWNAFTVSRKFGEDSFAKGLTEPVRPNDPYVGVISEPTWRMETGLFGFNDRLLAAQSVAALRRKGTNAALIDVRALMAGQVSAAKVPVVVVFAQRVSAYYALDPRKLNGQLKAYRQSGGRIVWFGGGLPDRTLCDFPSDAASRVDIDKAHTYVWCWTRLPVETNAYATLTLKTGEHAARKLERTPNFKAGWQTPSNTTIFRPEALAFVKPLAELNDGGRSIPVGAAWPKVRPTVAYLPTYTAFPYLWTKEVPDLFPFRLGLDSQGTDALETALDAVGFRSDGVAAIRH